MQDASHRSSRLMPVLAATICLVAMGAAAGVAPVLAAEKPVPAEKNPPGDIPDTQVFVDYTAPQGYALKVPEGWARSDRADGASFVDKLDGVVVAVSSTGAAPTVATAKANEVPQLEKTGRAVRVSAVKAVKLPAGPAIRIVYTSNSEPNAVTSRQVRLENERFLFFRGGKLVTLEFYAPKGADNADQWQLMSKSFKWQ